MKEQLRYAHEVFATKYSLSSSLQWCLVKQINKKDDERINNI